MTEARKSPSPESIDRIERSIEIRAPLARVWRALADAEEFGAWFGVELAGQTFVAGNSVKGRITHPGYEHLVFTAQVERVEPERRLAFRWHPYAIDPATDYSSEATTLVEFELEATTEGTRLRVVESGFDALPPASRASRPSPPARRALGRHATAFAALGDKTRLHLIAVLCAGGNASNPDSTTRRRVPSVVGSSSNSTRVVASPE